MNHRPPALELASPFFFVVGYIACGICGHRADFSAKGPYGALREISEHLAEHFEEFGRPETLNSPNRINEKARHE